MTDKLWIAIEISSLILVQIACMIWLYKAACVASQHKREILRLQREIINLQYSDSLKGNWILNLTKGLKEALLRLQELENKK